MASELITRGDTAIWDLPIVDASGVPFDLTGSTVWFTVKSRFNLPDDDAVVSSSWSEGAVFNGITVDHPESGEISYSISADQSVELIASLYVADVQVLDSNDVVTTVWKLRLAVGAGATARVSTP